MRCVGRRRRRCRRCGGGAGGRSRGAAEQAGKGLPRLQPLLDCLGAPARLAPPGRDRSRERRARCRGAPALAADAVRVGARVAFGTAAATAFAALGQTRLLVGRSALPQGVGAIALAQAALEPQRARQIGDGLRGQLLLPVGDAAIEQRLGHDGGRQVAAGEHRGQRLRRLGRPCRPRGASPPHRWCSAPAPGPAWPSWAWGPARPRPAARRALPLGSLGFGFRLGRATWAVSAPPRSTAHIIPMAAAADAATASLRQCRAMMRFPVTSVERDATPPAHKVSQFVRAKQIPRFRRRPSIPQSPTWRGCAAGPRPCP